jgi:polyisoprenoid-binding protein YceI
MRSSFIALSLAAFTAVAAPAVAQAPMAVPGSLDASRVQAGTYAVDSDHTQVEFKVNHLGFNSYYGIFGGATGSLTLDPARPSAASVSIQIPLANLVTTNEKLNAHLKTPDFFDAAKFPTATFTSTSVSVSGQTAKIAGNLTLKGVTRPVVLDARFTGAGPHPMNKKAVIGFEATTIVKRSDFGVSYGVPLVSDEVPLRITAAFEK